jgi:hypothetical protein
VIWQKKASKQRWPDYFKVPKKSYPHHKIEGRRARLKSQPASLKKPTQKKMRACKISNFGSGKRRVLLTLNFSVNLTLRPYLGTGIL